MQRVVEPSYSLPAILMQLLAEACRWTLGRERRAVACKFQRALVPRASVVT
jgi:hypothetical protein